MCVIKNVARNKLKSRELATTTSGISSSNMTRQIFFQQEFEHVLVLVPVGLPVARLLFVRLKRSRRRDDFGSGA